MRSFQRSVLRLCITGRTGRFVPPTLRGSASRAVAVMSLPEIEQKTAPYITGGGRLLKDTTEEACTSASPAICTPLYEFSCFSPSNAEWARREKQLTKSAII